MLPSMLIILSGEEGSGKTYAAEFFADKFKTAGLNVVKVPEDTSPFFGKGVKTFDAFCKLPAEERRIRSFQVLQKRIKLEEEFLFHDKYPEDKLTAIVLDRPWWDTLYYSLRRSEEYGQDELNPFDVMSMLNLSGMNLSYPTHCMTVVYNLLPLSPKILALAGSQNFRPERVMKSGHTDLLHRIKWYKNYNVFLNSLIQQLLMVSPRRLPFSIVSELNTLNVTPELKRIICLKEDTKSDFLTVPAAEAIRARVVPLDYQAGGKNIKESGAERTNLTVTNPYEQLILIAEAVRMVEGGMVKKPFATSLVKGLSQQLIVSNLLTRNDNLHVMFNLVRDFTLKVRSMLTGIEEADRVEANSGHGKKIEEGDPDIMKRLFKIASKGGLC